MEIPGKTLSHTGNSERETRNQTRTNTKVLSMRRTERVNHIGPKLRYLLTYLMKDISLMEKLTNRNIFTKMGTQSLLQNNKPIV